MTRLRAKTKIHGVLIRDMLFLDDDAVTTPEEEQLQNLMDDFSQACENLYSEPEHGETSYYYHQ